jgi:hypothetical protein
VSVDGQLTRIVADRRLVLVRTDQELLVWVHLRERDVGQLATGRWIRATGVLKSVRVEGKLLVEGLSLEFP